MSEFKKPNISNITLSNRYESIIHNIFSDDFQMMFKKKQIKQIEKCHVKIILF